MPTTKIRYSRVWFYEAGAQQAVLEEAKRHGHQLVCMQETLPPGSIRFHPNGRKVVWFAWASFCNPAQFVEMLESVSAQERSFYEILPTAGPIPLLFDIEWVTYGVDDDNEELKQDRTMRLSCLVQLVASCLKTYGILQCDLSEFVIKESHRAVEGGFKNSFHLIHPTIGFDCMSTQNHFIQHSLLPKMLSNSRLCCPSPGAAGCVPKPIVDTRIYTANRAFRTPLSLKAGGKPEHAFRITSAHSTLEGLVSSRKPLPEFTLTMAQLKRSNMTIEGFFQRKGTSGEAQRAQGNLKRKASSERITSNCASKHAKLNSCPVTIVSTQNLTV